jgi:hypothetical protein
MTIKVKKQLWVRVEMQRKFNPKVLENDISHFEKGTKNSFVLLSKLGLGLSEKLLCIMRRILPLTFR